MEETTGRKWLSRILDFINPLRDPSLTVAAVLTFVEEAGQHDAWYWIVLIALVNWLAVRGVVWLVVNFTFAATFVGRRVWWSIKNPRLAWRILDAVGHEEIVIGGGLAGLSEGVMLQDGTTIMSQALGASGIHIIGELPAGTELPVLNVPALPEGGQMAADISTAGFFPGGSNTFNPNFTPNGNGYGANGNAFAANGNGFAAQPTMDYQQMGNNGYVSSRSTDGLPPNFSPRPSEEEERLRLQLEAVSRLLDDWVQYTEEKWRTVSDSQLGWKPLRGRWSSWDDIFQDVYAAKTSDPMAKAAQSAGEATARRYDSSKEKGSAASAVACFMRDMMTLRRGIEMMQITSEGSQETPDAQPAVQSYNQRFGNRSTSGSLLNGSGLSPRNTLIRKPAQIFVDADTDK